LPPSLKSFVLRHSDIKITWMKRYLIQHFYCYYVTKYCLSSRILRVNRSSDYNTTWKWHTWTGVNSTKWKKCATCPAVGRFSRYSKF
jgi:hypothetical protein